MEPPEDDEPFYKQPTEDELAHDVLDMLEMGLTRKQIAERGGLGHGLGSTSGRRFRKELAKQYEEFTAGRNRAAAAAASIPEHADPFVALDGVVATPDSQRFGTRSARDLAERRWFGYLVRGNSALRRELGGAPNEYELRDVESTFKNGFIDYKIWKGRIQASDGKWHDVRLTMKRSDPQAFLWISGSRKAIPLGQKIW